MNYEEKTVTSECVYDGKVITVDRDVVELADGTKSVREVVKHSGGVVILAFKNNDTLLLVRQYRYPTKKTVLELPAGKLEVGEDPDFAAKRELEEETGYQANKWTKLGYINTSPGFCDEKLYLYKAQDLHFVGAHPDQGEIISAVELSVSEVIKKVKSDEINDAKTICAILRGIY